MNPHEIRIYTTAFCPYCWRAKRLLRQRGLRFLVIPVDRKPALRAWLAETSGQLTVPQVFVGERSIGGLRELHSLDRIGSLEHILTGKTPAPPSDPS
ncbi:MAG TPA: glutaredoxin [Nannocystis exedens]|nr:glutaredoxin [Nannocystis exedens]